MSDLYNRLAQKASEKGMTPSALCTKAGVTRSRMTELKNGKIKTLSTETLRRFALALNTTVEELVYGEERPESMRILPGESSMYFSELCARMSNGDLLSLLNAATKELQRRQSSAEKE